MVNTRSKEGLQRSPLYQYQNHSKTFFQLDRLCIIDRSISRFLFKGSAETDGNIQVVRYATKAVSCRRQSVFFSQWCTVLRVFHKALHIAHRTSLQVANLRTCAGEVTGSNLDWDTDCHQATSAPKLLAIPPMLHVSSSCQYHSTNATRIFHSQNTSLSLSLSLHHKYGL